MISEAEIIVRAHIEDSFATGDRDVGVLRCGDDAFGFVKSLRLYFFERLGKLLLKFGEHKTASVKPCPMQKPDFRYCNRTGSVALPYAASNRRIPITA